MTGAKDNILVVLCLMASFQNQAQHSHTLRLGAINRQFTIAYLHRNLTGFLKIYSDSVVIMPEFHLTIF